MTAQHIAEGKSYWFGLRPPAGMAEAWGCRAIIERDAKHRPRVSCLWDRQSSEGDPRMVKHLHGIINAGALTTALKQAGDLVGSGWEDGERLLFQNLRTGLVIWGNPRRSHGYIYMVAYLQRPFKVVIADLAVLP